ncbi:MAG: extracellular solute-binding protein, partial [Oscillospiraceae bacterium]|nr:extracellular solute-binding protein [Oscillospiraceae bacterium]
MKKLTRILAGLMSLSLLVGMTACSSETAKDSSHYKEQDDVNVSTADVNKDIDLNGQTIYWLSVYDLNPNNNNDRSVAMTLFEDQFHGKVEWIQCTSDDKFDTLTNRILGGDPVDMFPYEWDALPNGVYKDQYQPLDDYIDLDDSIWDGIRDGIDMYEYNGKHYVVPYAISDPLLIIYSRRLCEENGLDDPYELYQKGDWDWDAFMEMMKTFVANGDSSNQRYGIAGWFGQAMVQSTGKTIVNFDGKQFTNNISDPDIEKAENLMAEMHSLNLYDPNWYSYFPDTGNVLFYGMSDWSLSASNANNPDADLMVVPFPKSPDADEYYLCANYAAKMLVKNSTAGEAVGTYIYCERLAEINEDYKQAA